MEAGSINRDFSAVNDQVVYCYEGLSAGGPPVPGVVLLQLYPSTALGLLDRLRIEHFPAALSCVSGPLDFSGPDSGLHYQR